jgi:hypothetical protein
LMKRVLMGKAGGNERRAHFPAPIHRSPPSCKAISQGDGPCRSIAKRPARGNFPDWQGGKTGNPSPIGSRRLVSHCVQLKTPSPMGAASALLYESGTAENLLARAGAVCAVFAQSFPTLTRMAV